MNVHPAKAEVRFRDAGEVRALVISAIAPRAGRRRRHRRHPAAAAAARIPVAPLWLHPAPAGRSRYGGSRAAARRPAGRCAARPVPRPVHRRRPGGVPARRPGGAGARHLHPGGRRRRIAGAGRPARRARAADPRGLARPVAGRRRAPAAADAAGGGRPAARRRRAAAGAGGRPARSSGWRSRRSGRARCWCARMPAALGAPEPGPLLRDLADELAETGETTTLAARLDAVLARLACHGSIRAGRRLRCRKWTRCCARWKRPRAPTPAATAARPGSS